MGLSYNWTIPQDLAAFTGLRLTFVAASTDTNQNQNGPVDSGRINVLSPPTSLSKGAKAGIGTGSSIAGLLLIVGAASFFLWRRRKRMSRSRNNMVDPFQKPELEGQGTRTHSGEVNEVEAIETYRPEIGGGQMVEVEGEDNHAHLQALGAWLPVEIGHD